mmetsp:Transcript_89803/g.187694  ORF Transcript_89803/g.187694 Transcript_89803/m.187694 type:complete len:83 (+) Transcript_89803:1320-1568(+)
MLHREPTRFLTPELRTVAFVDGIVVPPIHQSATSALMSGGFAMECPGSLLAKLKRGDVSSKSAPTRKAATEVDMDENVLERR